MNIQITNENIQQFINDATSYMNGKSFRKTGHIKYFFIETKQLDLLVL